MKKYGYIRVSTKEQNPERQMAALLEFSIRKAAEVLHMSPATFYRRCQERIAGENGKICNKK